MPSLTLSGSEITDAVRTAGIQGDGLTPPAGVGVWEATTNLCTNGGFETNLTGWVGTTPTRVTSKAKFGAASMQLVQTTGDIVSLTSNLTGLTPSVAYTASAWVFVPVGTTINFVLQEFTVVDGFVGQSATAFDGTGTWQRISVTRTFGATGVHAMIYFVNAAGTSPSTYWVDGVQFEQKPIATPYVETNGATASRAAARVQAPASLLNATQGWVAMRMRMGWASSAVGTARAFYWQTDANNYITLQWTTYWSALRAAAGSSSQSAVGDTFSAGDYRTIVMAWDSGYVYLSIGGAAFVGSANTFIPALTNQLEIGSGNGQFHIDSDILWTLAGSGTLTHADAATINGYGNTAPVVNSPIPGSPTFQWNAVTSSYTAYTYSPGPFPGYSPGVSGPTGSITFTVDHLDHYGNILSTMTPTADSLAWTYRLANAGGPGDMACDFALSDTNMYENAFAAYVSDFSLNMHVSGGASIPLMRGICTGVNLKNDLGVVSFVGKDWLHYLEQPFPHTNLTVGGRFGYQLTLADWRSLLDSTRTWNASAGTNSATITYNATLQTVVSDLITSLSSGTYDPIAPILAPLYLGNVWTKSLNYSFPWGDQTTVLDHINTIARLYDPRGFDWWVVANPDKQVILNGPRVLNPNSITPVATLTGADTIVAIDWTNTGPRATETVVMGSGLGNGRPWLANRYTSGATHPSEDLYRRWTRIVSIANPGASITSPADVMLGLADAIGFLDRFPQKDLRLRIKPDYVIPGNAAFMFYPLIGECLAVNYTGFSRYHHINAQFYMTAQSFSTDAAGNFVCDLTLEQIYT